MPRKPSNPTYPTPDQLYAAQQEAIRAGALDAVESIRAYFNDIYNVLDDIKTILEGIRDDNSVIPVHIEGGSSVVRIDQP